MREGGRHDGSCGHRLAGSSGAALWPTLFGRATLLAANQRVRPVLVALRAACNPEAAKAVESVARVRALLTPELGVHLAEHFGAEESESYFGVMLREAPWLGREIAGMKDEHHRLLALLARLVLAATGRETPKVLAWQAERVAMLLQAHERKEGQLVRRFLLADGTGGD